MGVSTESGFWIHQNAAGNWAVAFKAPPPPRSSPPKHGAPPPPPPAESPRTVQSASSVTPPSGTDPPLPHSADSDTSMPDGMFQAAHKVAMAVVAGLATHKGSGQVKIEVTVNFDPSSSTTMNKMSVNPAGEEDKLTP